MDATECAFNPEEEWDKLFRDAREEIKQILITILFPPPIIVNYRKEVKTLKELVYFYQHKKTQRIGYVGASISPSIRGFNHRVFKEFGEVFRIWLFEIGNLPMVVRMSLECLGKIAFLPDYSKDMDKAHLSDEKLLTLRKKMQEWILANCPPSLKELLDLYILLATIELVETDKGSSWETCPKARHRMTYTINGMKLKKAKKKPSNSKGKDAQ